MTQPIRCLIIIFFSVLVLNCAHASEPTNLDLLEINIQLESIQQQLVKKKLDYKSLKASLERLATIDKMAKSRIEDEKKALDHIDKLLGNVKGVEDELKNDPNYNYLESESSKKKELIANYSLILYKSHKLQEDIRVEMVHTPTENILTRQQSAWQKIKWSEIKAIKFDKSYFYRASGMAYFSQKAFLLIGILAFSGGLLLSYAFYTLRKNLRQRELIPTSVLTYLFPALMSVFGVFLFLNIELKAVFPKPLILVFVQYLLMYLMIVTFTRMYIFWSVKRKWISESWGKLFTFRFDILMLLMYGWMVSSAIFSDQELSTQIVSGFRNLYWSVAVTVLFWTFWSFFHLQIAKNRFSEWVIRIGKSLTAITWSVVIVAAWFGYERLAIFFVPNLVVSMFLVFLAWRGTLILRHYYLQLQNPENLLSQKIHAALGMPQKRRIIEIFVLRILINITMIGLSLVALMLVWDVPQYYIDVTTGVLLNDIFIMGIPFKPVQIARGACVFCVLMLFGRFLAVTASKASVFSEEAYARITVVTLVNYVSFVVALCVGLLIAGVNLSGFALVAGALSVGVGFGLQSLAADLVSGLILLINRPVKPGDHVVIDSTEGFVKKIRLLSTQIKTMSKSNVIIPNSYLISRSVTNYTYKGKLSRITCKLIIANIEDIDKAEQAFLEVANSHVEVIKKGRNKPKVLFSIDTSFMTSTVTVTLWCHIRDVNKMYAVSSDINIETLKKFKALGIALK